MEGTAVLNAVDDRIRTLREEWDALEKARAELVERFGGEQQRFERNGDGDQQQRERLRNSGKRGETMKAIRDLLKEHPEGLTIQEIAKLMDRKPSYVYTATARMIDRKIVKREGRKLKLIAKPEPSQN
jgi:hypothetical protein